MSTPLIDDIIPCIPGISSIFETGNVQLCFVEMAMAPAVNDLLELRQLYLLPQVENSSPTPERIKSVE